MLTCRWTTSPRAKFKRKAPGRICAICAALHGGSSQSRRKPADSHSTACVPKPCHAFVPVVSCVCASRMHPCRQTVTAHAPVPQPFQAARQGSRVPVGHGGTCTAASSRCAPDEGMCLGGQGTVQAHDVSLAQQVVQVLLSAGGRQANDLQDAQQSAHSAASLLLPCSHFKQLSRCMTSEVVNTADHMAPRRSALHMTSCRI